MPRKRDPNAEKKIAGGQTVYTRQKADAILSDWVEAGDRGLREIATNHGTRASTVIGWVTDDRDGFGERYARASQVRWDLMAFDTVRIADDLNEDPNSRRVRVDTRKWLLSKMNPNRYGDKVEIGTGGLVTFIEALRQVGTMIKGGDEAGQANATHARAAQIDGHDTPQIRIAHIIDNES